MIAVHSAANSVRFATFLPESCPESKFTAKLVGCWLHYEGSGNLFHKLLFLSLKGVPLTPRLSTIFLWINIQYVKGGTDKGAAAN